MKKQITFALCLWLLVPLASQGAQDAPREFCDLPREDLKYEALKQGEVENFYRFIKVFACVFDRGDVAKYYYPRIDFPLPYESHTTEGIFKGTLSKKDLEIRFFAGNSEPQIRVADDRAAFSQRKIQGGEGYTWFFRLVDGRWRLYKTIVDSY